ncbi:hypothetical protein COO60DRAFT_129552 [Scenedesmus sp. NREL 46B-D3]|nr:hypothetical protein COO60DRAFT_129552 [Scenedesmus sp. NREL 46B-D3]
MHHKLLLLPMPQQPTLLPSTTALSAGQAATSAAAAGPSSSNNMAPASAAVGASTQQQQQQQQQQQPRRQLLCAEEQLQALCSMTAPGEDTCIVQECILARDGLSGSTCPVRSGFIFLGHSQPTNACAARLGHSSDSGSGSCASARSTPAGDDAACAAAAGRAATADVAAVAADIGSLASQPWVTAAHGLTSASAVHVASRAGLLPPVIDHASTGSAEYIEFAAPTQQQLTQQRQEWAALSGRAAASSSSGGAAGAGGGPAGGWVAPVLWFRFADAPRGNDGDGDGDGDDGLQEAAPAAAVEAAAGFMGLEEQQGEPRLDDSSSSSSSSSADESEASDEGNMVSADEGNQDAGESQQQQHQGAAAAAGAMEGHRHGLPQAAAGQHAASSTAGATNGAGAAAVAAPTPRVVPARSGMLCQAAPELPAAATEVAAALGWLPTDQHAGMLAVQLQQARSANCVCALLLECEDVQPAFNSSRGGCNIDMQLVMLRGHAVGELPQGLEVVPAGQRC